MLQNCGGYGNEKTKYGSTVTLYLNTKSWNCSRSSVIVFIDFEDFVRLLAPCSTLSYAVLGNEARINFRNSKWRSIQCRSQEGDRAGFGASALDPAGGSRPQTPLLNGV